MIGKAAEDFVASAREQGLVRTIRAIPDYVIEKLYLWHFARTKESVDNDGFDELHGVDTKKGVFLHDLPSVQDVDMDQFHAYFAAPAALTRQLLGRCASSSELRDFTFIDLGGGKGRALLVASEFPFKKLVSVELSSELCEIARRNLETYRPALADLARFEVVCADATTYPVPSGNLVVYMFNPFGMQTMLRVVKRLATPDVTGARTIYVVYVRPLYGELFTELGGFLEIERSAAAPKQGSTAEKPNRHSPIVSLPWALYRTADA